MSHIKIDKLYYYAFINILSIYVRQYPNVQIKPSIKDFCTTWSYLMIDVSFIECCRNYNLNTQYQICIRHRKQRHF